MWGSLRATYACQYFQEEQLNQVGNWGRTSDLTVPPAGRQYNAGCHQKKLGSRRSVACPSLARRSVARPLRRRGLRQFRDAHRKQTRLSVNVIARQLGRTFAEHFHAGGAACHTTACHTTACHTTVCHATQDSGCSPWPANANGLMWQGSRPARCLKILST